jgi:hypothetical protein
MQAVNWSIPWGAVIVVALLLSSCGSGDDADRLLRVPGEETTCAAWRWPQAGVPAMGLTVALVGQLGQHRIRVNAVGLARRKYKHVVLDANNVHSAWLLPFYERVTVIGVVKPVKPSLALISIAAAWIVVFCPHRFGT